MDVNEGQMAPLGVQLDLPGKLIENEARSLAPSGLAGLSCNHLASGATNESVVGPEEAVVFAAEELVEGSAGDLGAADHVADPEVLVPVVGDGIDQGAVDSG